MLLFQPLTDDAAVLPSVRLLDTLTDRELSEADYYEMLRQIYNRRNPHAAIGEDIIETESDD